MAIAAAQAIRRVNPDLPIVLGGISPIDPHFIQLIGSYGVLDHVDVVALHGFPLDWNHWSIHDWPKKIDEIRASPRKPIWVSEAGASSFGAEEVQVFGMQQHRRVAAAPRRARALVQPLRPARHLDRHHAPQGIRGQRLLPPLLHGAGARGRHSEARRLGLSPGHGHLPVVPLRGPPARGRAWTGCAGSRCATCAPASVGRTPSARMPRPGSTGR